MSNMVKDKPNRSEKKLKPPLWKSLLKPKLSPKKYTPEQEQEEEKTERNSSEASSQPTLSLSPSSTLYLEQQLSSNDDSKDRHGLSRVRGFSFSTTHHATPMLSTELMVHEGKSSEHNQKNKHLRPDLTTSPTREHSKVRSHSSFISVADLSKDELKCVVDLSHFKVFENGKHLHNLKPLPIIEGKVSNSKVHNEIENHLNPHNSMSRQKTGMSAITKLFKPHKLDDKEFENAKSLIPKESFSKLEESIAHKTTSEKFQVPKDNISEDQDIESIPNIVNPNAAIDKIELCLITSLSKRIRDGLERNITDVNKYAPPGSETCKEVKESFSEKYGKPIGIIGHGSYGVVKVCRRPKTLKDSTKPPKTYSDNDNVYFAVKKLKPKSSDRIDKFCTRITSEFIIGYSLSHHAKDKTTHPNILRIIDLMEYNHIFVEVMEFCACGDLYTLLTTQTDGLTKLHPLEADCFMKQLLHAISFMHKHGIAHCDLKPENILFQSDGRLKVCDFGTGNVFQTAWEKHVHFQSGMLGTEPYMPPEEFLPGKEYDPRLVDVWSCGVVYCSMILGHYLWKIAKRDKDQFFDAFMEEMTLKQQFGAFEEMKHINAEIKRFRRNALYRIFQWDPVKRISVDQLLQTAWMKNTTCCVEYKDCH